MNIFIDSNILYQDYFFENKSNKKLLKYSTENLITIFMSDIVRLELRRQFENEIIEKNREISKIKKATGRLKLVNNFQEILISEQLSKFDDFYQNLFSDNNFELLPSKNEYFPDIINRAINRIKPFTESKAELKDAIIWKTYSECVETNDLSNCILLTDNSTDFCQKKDKSKIHQDLLVDTKRFLVINSSFAFIKEKAKILESPEHIFQSYLKNISINNEFVFDIILEKFQEKIKEKIHSDVYKLHPSEIAMLEYFFDGQIVPHDIELINCEEIEYEVLSDTALISGILTLSCDTELWEYNSVRDSGEDRFSVIGEKYIIYKIMFNFDLKQGKVYSDFEITDLKIIEVN